ncbi:ribonuclease E activity regulator RraA [Hyphomicrobium sp. D-2]|uniref:ribonuclease E activity regulator RraA n=1 Tax=Hyphomicrobium sp. D-2 TaxID=3041621 RepID=UPI002456EEFD|nr:ribonuclease E activity regulator RraA [Hyphomicrobium sp. D-2]MDH4981727.1 ribonuclease E activity regulator RraA [Hyphomicrobium sp. D-2]
MLGTCDLSDRFPDARVAAPVLRDFGGRRTFSGRVVTVKCFEDNSRIKELLATAGEGRVLAVDGGGSLRCALMGDMIAADAVANGWAGVVIDGCVRDTGVLATLDIGIKALAANPRRSTRRGEGSAHIDIRFAETPVREGDFVVADDDGVVFLSAEQAAEAELA